MRFECAKLFVDLLRVYLRRISRSAHPLLIFPEFGPLA